MLPILALASASAHAARTRFAAAWPLRCADHADLDDGPSSTIRSGARVDAAAGVAARCAGTGAAWSASHAAPETIMAAAQGAYHVLPPGATVLGAPAAQQMSAAPFDLRSVPGVVIKQVTQAGNVALALLDAPFELAYQYKVYALPQGVRAARDQPRAGGAAWWDPSLEEISSLPQLLHIQEESSAALRVLLAITGGLNLRALTLHCCAVPPAGGAPEARNEVLTVERPCRLGGCCCSPLEMTLRAGPRVLGGVQEDYDGYCGSCLTQCCHCIYNHKVLVAPGGTTTSAATGGAGWAHAYSLRTGLCCCGRVNNCCGATCCKPNLIMDVLTPDGKLASTVQKTYGAGRGCAGCMRCVVQFDTFLVEFPEDATSEERALLLTAVLSQEYALFSRQGGDNS